MHMMWLCKEDNKHAPGSDSEWVLAVHVTVLNMCMCVLYVWPWRKPLSARADSGGVPTVVGHCYSVCTTTEYQWGRRTWGIPHSECVLVCQASQTWGCARMWPHQQKHASTNTHTIQATWGHWIDLHLFTGDSKLSSHNVPMWMKCFQSQCN